MIDLDVFIVNLSVTRPQAVVLMWLESYWTGSAMHIYGVQCLRFLGNHWSASCHQSISRTKSWRFVLFYTTIKLKYLFLYLWCTVSTCKYQYPSWNDWVCIYVTNIHIKYYWYVTVFLSPDFTISCWHVKRISRAESKDFPPLYSIYILGLNTCWKLCWTAGD